ncbi:MAG TPA: hydantoinase/oxoprolinase family protein [Nevskiales bacterium]|nr:hydantoinase/oxoprolinase family protein [Nevskiales bacterium]
MGMLISIDNGGTLTDFCVVTDTAVHHAKTLTTPYDLSKCFFEGLQKVSGRVYGKEDVGRLLREAEHIRYSTTVGTNALVERKGPRLGVISTPDSDVNALSAGEHHAPLFAELVGDRVRTVDAALDAAAFDAEVIRAVNELTAAGASRVVVSVGSSDFKSVEARIKAIIQKRFPSHLLGAMPLLCAADLTDDARFVRRSWTALLNAFLHPAMERFLYSADYRLKSQKTTNPLLVFRNDGGSARVAKTTAVKTYSSGPRGGMEGIRALADHYGYRKVVSYDVGGTTTDIGVVENGEIRCSRRGRCEEVEIAFPLADVHSAGVGGSSIIRANGKGIEVGPRSVGAVPGPACFGRGGKDATITDVYLLQGVLDKASYFGGDLVLDEERARASIEQNVAAHAGWHLSQALLEMENAWVEKIAQAITYAAGPLDGAVLAGFGGAGALAATAVADRLDVRRVLIPRLAAVFSAYGINFSDVSQEYQMTLGANTAEELRHAYFHLVERARRDMFAEGAKLSDCTIRASLLRERGDEEAVFDVGDAAMLPCELVASDRATLYLRAVKPVRKARIPSVPLAERHDAKASASRKILGHDGERITVPLYRVEELAPGATACGPALVEEAYFTGKVGKGWMFEITASSDILLTKGN